MRRSSMLRRSGGGTPRGAGTPKCARSGFVDPDRVDYRLRTFPDRESALAEGYVITHRDHCGACSSLRNLAVYLANTGSDLPGPDLRPPTGRPVG